VSANVKTSATSTLIAMMLTKRDRNKIYETITLNALDPAEFNLEDTDNKVLISHHSGATFEFSDRNPLGEFQVEAQVPEGINETSMQSTFDYVVAIDLPHWLEAIRLTSGIPDLWTEMQRSQRLVADIRHEDMDNSSFTEDEQRQIAALLEEIKKQIKEGFELTGEQIIQVHKGVDEVVEASKRMGRKDWFIYFLGTITALMITATVTGGMGEHIINMVLHGLAHLFGDEGEPPQLLA
jgi:hypothetical protein